MEFKVFGGYELPTPPKPGTRWRQDFWSNVNENTEGDDATTANRPLSEACGCYAFAIRYGGNFTPMYVGKAEFSSFNRRFRGADHGQLLKNLYENYYGTLVIFLLPALTPGGMFRLAQLTQEIRVLEETLIGMALRENEDLLNVKGAALLSDMYVPGVINPQQGNPGNAALALKNALGS